MISGSLNLLEPSGPHRACYGTALPSFTIQIINVDSVRLRFSNFSPPAPYNCRNTRHVRLPEGAANINAYFQDTYPPGCFAGWQVWSLQACQTAQQQRSVNLKFPSCYFWNLKRLGFRGESVRIYIRTVKQLYSGYALYKCLFIHFYVWFSVHHKSILHKEPTRCNFGSIVY
jgi:hypothetical protein